MSFGESKASDSECASGDGGSVDGGGGGRVTSSIRLSSVDHVEHGNNLRRRQRTFSLQPTNSELEHKKI